MKKDIVRRYELGPHVHNADTSSQYFTWLLCRPARDGEPEICEEFPSNTEDTVETRFNLARKFFRARQERIIGISVNGSCSVIFTEPIPQSTQQDVLSLRVDI